MAEIQNHYYIDKIRKIRQKLPPQGDPTSNLRKIIAGKAQTQTNGFSINTVSPDEINRIIIELRNSKSCGLDNLDTFIIKLIRPHIIPAVTHLINTSISTQQFPTIYKSAKVVPLYKGKDSSETQPKSYCPVAILPIVSKILERVIHTQIVEYMNSSQLFHPNHHAYRSLHSTTTAMLSMHDAWVEAAEKGLMAGVVMVDMSAAFDVVDTSILLEKCKILNFNTDAMNWLKSYLHDRKQSVYVGGHLSTALSLEAGVPQGSILGPILYTIYTCDFPEVVHEENCPHSAEGQVIQYRTMCTECGGLCCFADDSTYTGTAETTVELSIKLKQKFQVMSTYLTENRLCINTDKTHLLIMSTRQKRRRNREALAILDTGNEHIKPSRTETLLGFQIHESMTFSQYIMDGKDALIKILNKRIGALKKIRNVASFKAKLNIANGIFMSKILYLLPLYGGCPDYLLSSIQKKQTEAIRQVTGKRWVKPGRKYVSTKHLLQQCGWLSIRQLAFYTTVLSVHKTLVFKAPEYLLEKLKSGTQHATRSSRLHTIERSHVDEARLSITAASWRWRGHAQHSLLPEHLKNESEMRIFKLGLKIWVKENVLI